MRILILPHRARTDVSIIAVQVKVGVEYVVKSSEFKFHELRVNETCLFGERKPIAWSQLYCIALNKVHSQNEVKFVVGDTPNAMVWNRLSLLSP